MKKIDCRFSKNKSKTECKNKKKSKTAKKKSKTATKKSKKNFIKNSDLKLYKPVPSQSKNKKYKVLTKKGVIHFGQEGYEDYTMHKDKVRRKNYCTRSKGIRDGNGKLTYNNKDSANYWARKLLWSC